MRITLENKIFDKLGLKNKIRNEDNFNKKVKTKN
jgi:hypothetical protein